ncbi:hypothetical protein [Streptomyces sp. ISL-86]|uniref:hypothetical protein n=1 Tax=Streptomyces sp. ISL-86 TaxID=2819187 RepID=UPI001BEB8AC3|nr:hypothetical protein [Streptomyces sp. ISL-86]MBT2456114.1 hypothetical protein [Streptomyces sp. ISL-86]
MGADYGPGVFGQDFGAPRVKALKVEYDTLSGYKNLVDDLLDRLGLSEADDKKLAHGTLPAGALGKGFPEAEALFKAYSTVHNELQNLSKGLAGQIEALGIAIRTAGKGYAGIDEETRRRMVAIAERAKKEYVPERDPLSKTYTTEPNAPAANGHTSEGTV